MRLILGRENLDGSEVLINANQPPTVIRRKVLGILAMGGDGYDAICTFSTVAANAYTYEFRKDGGVDYDGVFVWDGTRDRCVTEYLSREYMVHFALGDLYAAGEFDTLPKETLR